MLLKSDPAVRQPRGETRAESVAAYGDEARSSLWNKTWPAALLLIAATVVAYLPVCHAGFVWDDDVMLTENRFVQAADGLHAIWFSTQLPDYFPMTSSLFWLEWRLWGAQPLGYHLVNLLLHTLSALLWWRVLAKLKIPGAWFAAALFALHPVNVESVAWISEHKNTLAMFFCALTLLTYLRFEDTNQRRCYAFALVAFTLGLLSKTAVAPLPLVFLGLAWWRRGRVQLRDAWRSIPFFTASAVLAFVTIWFHHHRAIGSAVVRDDSFFSRLAGAGWAIWFYLSKTLVPLNLTFIYPRWQIDAANALAYVPGLLVVATLLICWRWRRHWGKAGLLGFGFFIVMLLPVLGFLTISFMRYSLVADRWQYFAIIGPMALATAIVVEATRHRTQLRTVLGGIVLLTLGILTWRQSGMYTDLETLWRTTLARNPNCAVAHTYLGSVLVQKGNADEAIEHFEKALTLEPGDELAHYNLGYTLLQRGQTDEAIAHFEKALATQPDSMPTHYHLGNAFLRKGQTREAAAQFGKAVEIDPGFAEARNSFGDVLLQMGKVDDAIAQFQKALQIQPDYPNALNNLGVALMQKGDAAVATTLFQKAVKLQPGFAEAQNNLGRTLLQKGKAADSLEHFRAALKAQPNDVDIQSLLAWVLATWPEASVRNGSEASELAQRANQSTGGQDPGILQILAAAYAEGGRFADAVATAERAVQLAESKSDAALAQSLRSQLALYQAGSPFREVVPTSQYTR